MTAKTKSAAKRKLVKSKPRKHRAHEFKMDYRGEFDEVFVENASVHIERMDEKHYWIGITSPGLPELMIHTGMDGGTWYFNLEEDACGGEAFHIERPKTKAPSPSTESAQSGVSPSAPADLASDPNTVGMMHDLRKP